MATPPEAAHSDCLYAELCHIPQLRQVELIMSLTFHAD
jgi:hypothetical protein